MGLILLILLIVLLMDGLPHWEYLSIVCDRVNGVLGIVVTAPPFFLFIGS